MRVVNADVLRAELQFRLDTVVRKHDEARRGAGKDFLEGVVFGIESAIKELDAMSGATQ